MTMLRRKSITRAATLTGLLGLSGCTEDPVLDRVGGTGTIVDARPPCGDTAPDAEPRFLPCDVEAILRSKCQRCHNVKAVIDRCYRAKTCVAGPFPLLTWSDTHQLYGGTPIFQLMHNAVLTDYMPFQIDTISPPVAPLDADEKAALIAWTDACAPAGSKSCALPLREGGALDGAGSGDK